MVLTLFIWFALTEAIYIDCWSKKFDIFNYKNQKIGFIEIEITTGSFELPKAIYRVEIKTHSKLPFWFFTGESTTSEIEYLDEDLNPLKFQLEIISKNESILIKGERKEEKIEMEWISNRKRIKNASLPFRNDILTAANLGPIILSRGVDKKNTWYFFLLDKYKLAYKKIKIETKEKDRLYIVDIDLGIFGNFSFQVDSLGEVIKGEGMGLKVFPVDKK